MKQMLGLIMASAMVLSLCAGCTRQSGASSSAPPPSSSAVSPAASSESASSQPEEAVKENPLPISKEPLTLSILFPFDTKASAVIKSYSEMGIFEEMAKLTNITLEFTQPSVNDLLQQFNLMVASDTLPDMAQVDVSKMPGGITSYISDGTVVKLNDLIDEYGPNLQKLYRENPQMLQDASLDDGTLYSFSFICESESIRFNAGFQMRTDWLDKVGLPVPETLDDWYTVLTAFKEQDPNQNGQADEIPLVAGKLSGLNEFLRGYGMLPGFYNDNGTVHYAQAMPAYKDFLTRMNQWYTEGLIDPDYLTTDSTSFAAKVTGNLAGGYFGTINGNLGTFLGNWKAAGQDYQLEPIPYPKAPDGNMYGFSKAWASTLGVVLTKSNQHLPESVQYWDFLYGDEDSAGYLLTNYGIEGKSYVMENGKPKFTDEIMNNPEGLSAVNALHRYNYLLSNGPGIQGHAFTEAVAFPEQTEAFKIYSDCIPINLIGLTPTAEESTRLNQIMSDVGTYMEENSNKFIMGQQPLEQFDSYIEQLKAMGIEEAVSIYQAMYDRKNK